MSGNGVAVVESTDAKALYAWVAEWADVLPLELTPCLDDAEAGEVLQAVKG